MAFRKRTNAYWQKRAEEQLTLVEQQAFTHLKTIDGAYRDAQRYTLSEVKKLYVNYYKKQGWDTTQLQQLVPRGDIRRFQEAVRAAGLASYLPDGYGFRLNRLELLEAQLWLKIHQTALIQQNIQTIAHSETIDTAYYHAVYNLSKGTGVAPAFAQLNDRAINRILQSRFYGKNYSERVWANSGKLANEIKQILASAVASGQSHSKTARQIRDRYGVKRWEAARLVRTETNHFNTEATMDSYQSIGLDEWVYLATLDSRTDDECAIHDGKHYPVGQGPLPPLHPDCRCTQRAYLGQEYEPDERIMRDPKTGKNRYISNMSFEQWKQLYI